MLCNLLAQCLGSVRKIDMLDYRHAQCSGINRSQLKLGLLANASMYQIWYRGNVQLVLSVAIATRLRLEKILQVSSPIAKDWLDFMTGSFGELFLRYCCFLLST